MTEDHGQETEIGKDGIETGIWREVGTEKEKEAETEIGKGTEKRETGTEIGIEIETEIGIEKRDTGPQEGQYS